MRARDTAGGEDGGEDARLWRRREGKNEKKGVELGREPVEQEGRDGTNGKMG